MLGLACPRRCDVARYLLLTLVTSPLRETTPSALLVRAESLFAHTRVCARAVHLLRAQTAANQHSARHRPTPRDPTFHPLKGPTWPATRKTRSNHAPASPPPGAPRRTGPTHPQRRSPGFRLPERLSAPPAARAVRRHVFCPAPPRRPPDARCGASQRGPTPARSSPASWLSPATPSSPVGRRCSLRQAPAKPPCTAQQTPQVAAVRSS